MLGQAIGNFLRKKKEVLDAFGFLCGDVAHRAELGHALLSVQAPILAEDKVGARE